MNIIEELNESLGLLFSYFQPTSKRFGFEIKRKEGLDLAFVTVGTVEYDWLLWPLSLLVYKYWGNIKIIYFSDNRTRVCDLPPNVEFRYMPYNKWDFLTDFGDGFRYIFEHVSNEIIFFTLFDMWPKYQIDLDRIRLLSNYLKLNKNIFRILIGDDINLLRFGHKIDSYYGIDIITANKDDRDVAGQVGFMLTPSLWDRKLTLDFLSNCSIWDFEPLHSIKIRNNNIYAVWTRQSIYPYWHTLSRADIGKKLFIHHFLEEDINFIKHYIPSYVEVYDGHTKDN